MILYNQQRKATIIAHFCQEDKYEICSPVKKGAKVRPNSAAAKQKNAEIRFIKGKKRKRENSCLYVDL